MDTAERATETMQLQVRLFSALREEIGQSEIDIALAAPATAGDLLDRLAAEHEAIAERRPVLRLAIGQTFVSEDVTLEEGDEVALITPVSGG